MSDKNGIKNKFPVIYIVDASINITGAFICARNEAVCLDGIAQVTLVLPNNSRIIEEKLKPFAKVLHLPIVNLQRSVRSFIQYFPALLVASWRLHRSMKSDEAEILQLNDFYLMHGAVCRVFGYRGNIVTWIRFDPRRFGRLLSRLWLKIAVSISNQVVAVSKFIQSTLPLGIETILIYDTLPFVDECEQVTVDIEASKRFQKKIVYIGNYIRGKGQDDAIKAFVHVAEQIPEISLAFYGGDMGLKKNRVYRSGLKKMVKQFGLESRVHFGDFLDDTSLVLRNAYLALNFSHSESFSMTVLEAAYAGLPVITTKSGGPAEIIENGVTGILVPVGDVDAMSSAIVQLANDPIGAKKMGESSRRLVEERFSQKLFLSGLRQVFRLDP